jgi:predicted nuclease with TOPRIM domain
MIFKWIDNLLSRYEKPETFELLVTDKDGDKHSLVGVLKSLAKEVVRLEERIKKLEAENTELTNCLYEVENRLNAKIDNIHPVVYNLKSNNWDQ